MGNSEVSLVRAYEEHVMVAPRPTVVVLKPSKKGNSNLQRRESI